MLTRAVLLPTLALPCPHEHTRTHMHTAPQARSVASSVALARDSAQPLPSPAAAALREVGLTLLYNAVYRGGDEGLASVAELLEAGACAARSRGRDRQRLGSYANGGRLRPQSGAVQYAKRTRRPRARGDARTHARSRISRSHACTLAFNKLAHAGDDPNEEATPGCLPLPLAVRRRAPHLHQLPGSPLELAVLSGQPRCAAALMQAGARLQVTNQ